MTENINIEKNYLKINLKISLQNQGDCKIPFLKTTKLFDKDKFDKISFPEIFLKTELVQMMNDIFEYFKKIDDKKLFNTFNECLMMIDRINAKNIVEEKKFKRIKGEKND